jgi:aminoglycoside phosphotransferase (APT) family kinase protein
MLSAHDAEVVRADPELPGLAVLLDPEAFVDVLIDVYPEMGSRDATITYLRYKPRTSCLCAYRISTAAGTVDVYAKAFRSGPHQKLRHWITGPASPAPVRQHRRASLRWGLGISRFPDDRRLEALTDLHDARRRARILASALADHQAWPGAELATLRYKPERRYVARLSDGQRPVAALKLYGDGFLHARARARLFRSVESLTIVPCVAESARHGILMFEWVPGSSLQELLQQGSGIDAAETAGLALAELHGQDVGEILAEPAGASGRAVRAAAGSIAATCPRLALRARALADTVSSALDESAHSLVPSHGDFYAEQVIPTAGGAAILDLDRACLAHPAADLGTFAGHLTRAALRRGSPPAHLEAAVDALLEGYARRRPVPASAQVSAYTAAALLRLATEPFRRHEEDWMPLTEALLVRVDHAIGQTRRAHRRTVSDDVVVEDRAGLAADPAWSFLRSALEPSRAQDRLRTPLARLGIERAQLREIRVTRLKPGRRAVIEYTFDDRSAGTPVTLCGKSRLKGLDRQANLNLESLWNAGFRPGGSPVCVPQPAGTLPEWRMTLQRKVAGSPADERMAGPDGPRIATRVAEAIHRLHSHAPVPVRQHTIADELRILRQRLPLVNERGGGARIEKLLRNAERSAAHLPDVEPRAVHRDFYPAHVLLDDHRLWLLDFDLYCAGDPSLDVGNFLAHLIEAWVRGGRFFEGPGETEAAFEARYLQLAGPGIAPAIRTYTTLALVRHVYLSTQFPERHHTTPALLELCERRLSRADESTLYA